MRPAVRSWLRWLVTVAVVVAIFVGVLPRIASYGDVWATIADMTWIEITSLVLVAAWNLVTYWFVLVAALPGLRLGQAAVVNQASTAISNTLPAGAALGVGVTYSMFSSWGFAPSAIARSVLISGIWNNFMKLGFPVIALALLAAEGDVATALVVAALVGVAVLVTTVVGFALLLSSDRLAVSLGDGAGRLVSRVRGWLGRSPVAGWGEAAHRFRADTVDLVADRWVNLTVSSLVSHVSLAIVLLLAARHVGLEQGELSWVSVLASFAFVRLISALPITPGGVGVVELGYVAALSIGLDQAGRTNVVAAVLVFRFLTYALPVPIGAVAYAYWRTGRGRPAPETASGFSGWRPGNT